MAKKKGRSEKKKDWLGRSYIQHYDADGDKSGRSERKETFWGKKYTQHYDSSGTKRGRSERKETWLGGNYTQKYNSQGEKSGTSEKKTTLLGKTYTQHYDSEGTETERSERKQAWYGKQYIERYGDDAPHKTISGHEGSRSCSSSESSWSGYSNPEATSEPARDPTPPLHPTGLASPPLWTAPSPPIPLGWTTAAGWIAAIVFCLVAKVVATRLVVPLLPHDSPLLGLWFLAWLLASSTFAGVTVTSILNRNGKRARTSAIVAFMLTLVFATVLGSVIAPQPKSRLSLNTVTLPVEDKLMGSTIGSPMGIHWTNALRDRGAIFSATDSSRIEYPGLIPPEGTLEFWIRVNSGYHYDNYQFKGNQDNAMIFSSDVQGGDVTWPGTTKLFVTRDGKISYWMATRKYDKPHSHPTEARGTKFRFGEWHAVGVSYGRNGQYIMLDGEIVAYSPRRNQTFGQAGNHQQPLDVPTIGETVSHFWTYHRYEGGFEGILTAFRVSAKQKDWLFAKGINGGIPIVAASLRSNQVNGERRIEQQ
jgi:hypothetical protein